MVRIRKTEIVSIKKILTKEEINETYAESLSKSARSVFKISINIDLGKELLIICVGLLVMDMG